MNDAEFAEFQTANPDSFCSRCAFVDNGDHSFIVFGGVHSDGVFRTVSVELEKDAQVTLNEARTALFRASPEEHKRFADWVSRLKVKAANGGLHAVGEG